VAGVTVPLIGLLETFYKDYSGQRIVLNPRAAVTDPAMRQIGLAEASYIESADTVRFRNVVATIHAVDDSLFALSQQAVDKGARIVCWSENNGIAWKTDEKAFIERGQRFAARNKIYLLMTICVVNPGKITPGKKFLENEAILAGPEGAILIRFHKNNPVPMVEASQPGDGIIPVVRTAYGRLAVSICYDADFPLQMQQVGDKGADLLLLPSGDWYAIAPFHTYMAVYRGVENGCSVFREVSNGLSVATDYRGKATGSCDWFRDGRSLWLTDLPVGHVNTIYHQIGDVLPYACLLYVLLTVVVLRVLRSRSRRAAPLVTDRMALQP
jgi:apolipoprotein N-acyltransferase